MAAIRDGEEKAFEVLKEIGGPLIPHPSGVFVVATPIIRDGRLTRVEFRLYNKLTPKTGEGVPAEGTPRV